MVDISQQDSIKGLITGPHIYGLFIYDEDGTEKLIFAVNDVGSVGYSCGKQWNFMSYSSTNINSKWAIDLSVKVLYRGTPGPRGPMIPPLLSLPPPPRGRASIRGGFGPRSGPYGRGWWGVSAEPPFPGPGHGGPSRGSFHKEQRNPRRLKSWSLIKNTCPPKDDPQVIEDKSGRPVCRHFAKKGHCRYEDLCAFYHPGVNGPPL
ncbi:proline-rich protein 3 isoform X1 [Carlito syrichta]|uniref:Proline-rich protein 3 n=1 Tax=Carlito syrichta TaxID=1868482 RepID=A0A3Q0DLI1_CARSF|nr:proline-rich protein 3 isoform X1 [Carlito syrichta]XP_021563253.1 proline-rich protein 3 isoform X1 [Carlito syrichta]